MEAYAEYILTGNSETIKEIDHEVSLEYFRSEDTLFYKILAKCVFRKESVLSMKLMFINTLLGMLCFISTVFACTVAYKRLNDRNGDCSLIKIWKALILSTFGIFLLLPALIWKGNTFHEFHITFVYLYITLSQLLAYNGTY